MKSWAEISAKRLEENFRAVGVAAGGGGGGGVVETLAVVKADAYGHGAAVCAPVLVEAGARWLGVADAEEGARVREVLGQRATRLLVMCGMEAADAPAMVELGLTPVVWTVGHIEAMERAAQAAGEPVRVHVEVDTGMGRQGAAVEGGHVESPELAAVLERLAGSRWVVCEGLMTHLCCSEVAGATTTGAQRERFAAAVQQGLAAGVRPEWMHVANTSAVDEGSTMAWLREMAEAIGARTMVRTGLAMYGYALPLEGRTRRLEAADGPGGTEKDGALRLRLQPVLTWKTRVIGIRTVEAGATVGYGATFRAEAPLRLALLPVGYADGFRRAASSGTGDGWVRIAGQRAPVVGRVSMNLTVVNVTAIPEAVEGSEVVLLGEGVTAEDHARWADTIAYEILCGLRTRLELG